MLILEEQQAVSSPHEAEATGVPLSKAEKIAQIANQCDHTVLENGALCFLELEACRGSTTEPGLKGAIQDFLKRNGKLYYWILSILGPVWCDRRSRRLRRRVLSRYGDADIILNLGSGPMVFMGRRDIINVDIFPFDEVDMVADAAQLPIESDSVDCAINIAMLEHVPDPQAVISEMHRVMREGGEFLCFVPFMQPYHAAPHDYHRWTVPGAEALFSDFAEVEITVSPGPTLGMLWVVQEWLAVLLSFGSKTVHDALLMALMVLTFPIKFLDEILVYHPNAQNLASGFFIRGTKRSQ